MPRTARVAPGGLVYHAMNRAVGGLSLFEEEVQPVIGSYVARPPACRDHDPRAADVARQIATLIASHGTARVEHVGSTAVPCCAGEGIVDLMIPVAASDMERTAELLQRLGFEPPPASADLPMFRGVWDQAGETFLLHVYVFAADAPEVDEMRFLRACLRGDPELVRVYVARKRDILAGGVTDSVEYARLKRTFIKEVLG